MTTIFKKNSRLTFLISLLWVLSMQNAIFWFNTSVTFMPLAFVNMGLGSGLTFFTVWKYGTYIIFEVLIHYYSGYSSILTFSLQFLLFRENSQFASWVSHNISRFCVLPLFYVVAALFVFLHSPLHSVPEKDLWISLSFTSRFLYVYSAAPLSHTLGRLICDLQIIQPVQTPFFKRARAREIVWAAAASWLITHYHHQS